MPDRSSSMRHDLAKDLAYSKNSYTEEQKRIAKDKMVSIMFEGKEELYNRCIICEKEEYSQGDHFVSAIHKRTARFRNGRILQINHPMNMVACCKNAQCNNESKKMSKLAEKESYKAYYEYVLQNCPTMNISVDEFAEINGVIIESTQKIKQMVAAILAKPKIIYTEDIDL